MSAPVYFTSGAAPCLHSSQPDAADTDPATPVTLEYLNEGGANFVFKILPANGTEALPEHLQGHLLRLRKDLPHVQSAQDHISAFDSHFKPLFPSENIVHQTPVELHHELPAAINEALRNLNRPSHRLQDFLADGEPHGLLITDMTPREGDLLLQVKPKWLQQSPTAPPDAKRCRTCALRAQRASKKVRTATDAQASCPLELISDEEADRRRAAQLITNAAPFQDFLVNEAQPLLKTLKENQENFDPKGALHANTPSEILNVCKAMTIRDCTLFLKLSGSMIEARLADLDLKQPEKLEQWKKVESSLIDGGWYANTEAPEHCSEERICLLSRLRTQE